MLPLIVASLSLFAILVTHHQASQNLQFGIISCCLLKFTFQLAQVFAYSLSQGLQVEPFNRALTTLQCDVMINGRRRDHGFERAHLELVEEGSPIKCNPLAWWEFKDCWDYIDKQGLQYHPLHDEVPHLASLLCCCHRNY